MIVQRVLKEGPFTLEGLAEAADAKYQTVRKWAAGLSTPRTENLRQLAGGLRKKSEELARLAEEVEKAARDEGGDE